MIDEDEINARLDAVEALTGQAMIREEIREYLRPVYDLERLVGRISYQSANPRDLIAFKSSLQMLPYIKQLLNSFAGRRFGCRFRRISTRRNTSISLSMRQSSMIRRI